MAESGRHVSQHYDFAAYVNCDAVLTLAEARALLVFLRKVQPQVTAQAAAEDDESIAREVSAAIALLIQSLEAKGVRASR
jgi:hypothetical protein